MMGQLDPAPVNIVSGSSGWRRGLGGRLNPLAKTVESLDRPPVRRGTQIIVNRGGRRVRDGTGVAARAMAQFPLPGILDSRP